MMKTNLDETNRRILRALQRLGRVTMAELAEHVNMSLAPVHKRVRKLEEDGIIKGYWPRVDRLALGLGVEVFLEVTFREHHDDHTQAFRAALGRVPEVKSVRMISGEADYLVQLVVGDIADYQRIVREVLLKLPMIKDIRSSIVLEEVFDNQPLHVD
ncbi:MAG: Lrp/AsnC family transcriptional regulator [Ruegeria sp.]